MISPNAVGVYGNVGLSSADAITGQQPGHSGSRGPSPAGAALYVSGAVKTSIEIFTNQTTAGSYLVSTANNGPAGSVTFSTVSTAVSKITINNNLISLKSSVIFTLSGFGGSPGLAYTVNVLAGQCVISVIGGSITFTANSGFNYLIIN